MHARGLEKLLSEARTVICLAENKRASSYIWCKIQHNKKEKIFTFVKGTSVHTMKSCSLSFSVGLYSSFVQKDYKLHNCPVGLFNKRPFHNDPLRHPRRVQRNIFTGFAALLKIIAIQVFQIQDVIVTV